MSKGILQQLNDFGVRPSDIMKEFMRAAMELSDEWAHGPADGHNYVAEEPEVEDENEEEDCQDFPQIEPFNAFGLDYGDGGIFQMGLPEILAVHTRPDQNRLIPIVDGMFVGEDY